MARVVRDSTVLPAEPCFCLSGRNWSSFYRPRGMEGCVDPVGWLHTHTRPQTVTHPSTNRVRCWLTVDHYAMPPLVCATCLYYVQIEWSLFRRHRTRAVRRPLMTPSFIATFAGPCYQLHRKWPARPGCSAYPAVSAKNSRRPPVLTELVL